MANEIELARSAYETGDSDRAMELMRSRLRKVRDDGRAWEMLGLLQYERVRFRTAVSSLERASLLVPLRPAGRVCLAHAYGRIGRRQLSKDLLVALIKDHSLSSELLLQVASGLESIDQPYYAMQACREVSQRDPECAQAFYDMGYYAARCGQSSQVVEYLARKAISLDPGRVNYRVGLASLLLKQERRDDAIQLVCSFSNEQIADIACANCLRRVASLYEASGDYRRAILCHQRLLQLELTNPDAAGGC
jgi:tetratricopeptide (TPR) repeat protein